MKAALLLVVALVAGANAASACECMSIPRTVALGLARSDAVFVGEVLAKRDSVEREGQYESPWGSFVAFHVQHAWKGAWADTVVTVVTPWQGGGCGYPFKAGERYLVYADSALPGRYSAWRGRAVFTDICTRTQQLWHAAVELRELGVSPTDSEWIRGCVPSWRDSVALVPLADSLARNSLRIRDSGK